MAWLQQSLFPWLEIAVTVCVFLWFIVFLPMFIFKKARPWIGVGLVYSSCLTGFTCWIFSFIVTYQTLGGYWLFIGLFFAGMGVFPLAVIGVLIHGLWAVLANLLFAIAMMIIPRVLGIWIGNRYEDAVDAHCIAGDDELIA